ncbi:hypothetical protein L9F63_004089 [Diploptera punctata]|uniref:tRNA (guanine(37)-N1)-methyltransferase n=1 Tax=Diploptera punctata TaxID=6984 RepID=A0AAD7ZH28_DIPPU|nr:hypothetical protein L9F63_004089 [Diploptera punctata]
MFPHDEITPKDANKRVVLNPSTIRCYEDISEADRKKFVVFGITEDSFGFSELTLTYSNWRGDELLKAILPEDKDSLTSYSLIGHIVHVNLREHLLDYKQVIGQVLLDKISGARTIVNKTDSIDNTFRNFSMEILCGDNDMIVQVKENHCIFEFNFASVYWNPRLSTEHERIVKKLKQGDVLYDVFAGVGPFSIPAAKKKCFVLANDLNPESYKWLQHNGKLNKVQAQLQVFNKDGGSFIKEDMKENILKLWKSKNYNDSAIHVTMNLPAMAVEFLENFIGLFTIEEIQSLHIKHFPIVYLYCFTKGDNPIQIAKELVEQKIGFQLKDDLIDIFHVRNVSVKKEMMRVTFRLSLAILTSTTKSSRKADSVDAQDGPQVKRICAEQDGENHEHFCGF